MTDDETEAKAQLKAFDLSELGQAFAQAGRAIERLAEALAQREQAAGSEEARRQTMVLWRSALDGPENCVVRSLLRMYLAGVLIPNGEQRASSGGMQTLWVTAAGKRH